MVGINRFAFEILWGNQIGQLFNDSVHSIYYLVLRFMLDILGIFIRLIYCVFTLEFFQISERTSFISFIFNGKATDQTLFLSVLFFTTAKSYYWLLSVRDQININYFDRFVCWDYLFIAHNSVFFPHNDVKCSTSIWAHHFMPIVVGMNEIVLLVTIRVTQASLLILLNADLEMCP